MNRIIIIVVVVVIVIIIIVIMNEALSTYLPFFVECDWLLPCLGLY